MRDRFVRDQDEEAEDKRENATTGRVLSTKREYKNSLRYNQISAFAAVISSFFMLRSNMQHDII